MNIECVILAAGTSTRFGSPKALATYQSKALLEIAIEVAKTSLCKSVNVVLGAHRNTIQDALKLDNINIITNRNFMNGMSSSIVCAVTALKDSDAILFMTTDQPLIKATDINALCNCFEQGNNLPVAAAFANDFGIPAVVPANLFPHLLKLTGDQGAKSVLLKTPIMTTPIDAAEFDIDTREDLIKLNKQKLSPT